jgi:UDP-glucose 4-epimerase
MRCFVTGGAGFIGSNLVDRLLADGHNVVVYDNLSTGRLEYLRPALAQPKDITVTIGDLLDLPNLTKSMNGCDFVFHLAANADVRYGLEHPSKDLEQNTIATHNVLEAMRANNIKKIVFSSTGSIYGEPKIFPTPETASFPIQTSLYGASKLACEGLIAAYCEGYNFQAWIFRFVSILGERYSHGHVHAFYKQLLDNPNELLILGDGTQSKSFLYIQDCLDAIQIAVARATRPVNIFNLGTEEVISINDSVGIMLNQLGISPKLTHTEGDRGWVGDNPFILLDTSRIQGLDWNPKVSIKEAIKKTLTYLQENPWIVEARD